MTSKQKLIGQIIGGIIFFIVFKYEGLATKIAFPFIGSIDIGWLYGIFVIFWLVGFSNAVNLTDGLDGLVLWDGKHCVWYLCSNSMASTTNRYLNFLCNNCWWFSWILFLQ